MYVCMYVCLYVCMYGCMYIYIYTYMIRWSRQFEYSTRVSHSMTCKIEPLLDPSTSNLDRDYYWVSFEITWTNTQQKTLDAQTHNNHPQTHKKLTHRTFTQNKKTNNLKHTKKTNIYKHPKKLFTHTHNRTSSHKSTIQWSEHSNTQQTNEHPHARAHTRARMRTYTHTHTRTHAHTHTRTHAHITSPVSSTNLSSPPGCG